ncbi:RNA polymerase sigma-70 factor [Flavobacterium sp. Sd200]|uniref:RNA polymerase sigma factor n=1 Tax=Flavobacterium sp. Sd200 TaxID=2692211 RepID=UPI00136F6C2B|nr:RNA polymerase sigma-70 factor [Flavobacterium sp. Sd200]MXN92341.1 RNA polymerase sigma-70 factor [Flavobacterium sp. Sd200]
MAFVDRFTDIELIEQIKNDDEGAFTVIYKKNWEIMYLAAYNLVKDKSVSEDIVQEVFVSLWQRRAKLEIKVSIKSYLYTSTIYKVYDHLKKNKKLLKQELFDNNIEAANPETKLMHEELIHYLDTVVDSLPAKCKEVYKLSRENMLSNKEIADHLDISQRTVEGHISKALKILKESLGAAAAIEFIIFIYS